MLKHRASWIGAARCSPGTVYSPTSQLTEHPATYQLVCIPMSESCVLPYKASIEIPKAVSLTKSPQPEATASYDDAQSLQRSAHHRRWSSMINCFCASLSLHCCGQALSTICFVLPCSCACSLLARSPCRCQLAPTSSIEFVAPARLPCSGPCAQGPPRWEARATLLCVRESPPGRPSVQLVLRASGGPFGPGGLSTQSRMQTATPPGFPDADWQT